MRIRHGFVSNSSSSSYIIGYRDVITIQVTASLDDIIDNTIFRDNLVEERGRDYILEKYQKELEIHKRELDYNRKHYKPDEIFCFSSVQSYDADGNNISQHVVTWGQNCKYMEENIGQIEAKIQEIQSIPDDYELIMAEISIHDEHLVDLVEHPEKYGVYVVDA